MISGKGSSMTERWIVAKVFRANSRTVVYSSVQIALSDGSELLQMLFYPILGVKRLELFLEGLQGVTRVFSLSYQFLLNGVV